MSFINKYGTKKVMNMGKQIKLTPVLISIEYSSIIKSTNNVNKCLFAVYNSGLLKMYNIRQNITVLDILKCHRRFPLCTFLTKQNLAYVLDITIESLIICKDVYEKRDVVTIIDDILADNQLLIDDDIEDCLYGKTKEYLIDKYTTLTRSVMLQKKYSDIKISNK